MTRITFNQITWYCDFAKLTYTMNRASLFIVMGREEGGVSHLWCHQSMLTSAAIAEVVVLPVLLPWPFRYVASCALVSTGKTWSSTAGATESLRNSLRLRPLRQGRDTPRRHLPPCSCDRWSPWTWSHPPMSTLSAIPRKKPPSTRPACPTEKLFPCLNLEHSFSFLFKSSSSTQDFGIFEPQN